MQASRRRQAKRRGLLTAALSIVGHATALAVLLWPQPTPPARVETESMTVALVAPPPPEPPPPPPEPPSQPEQPKAKEPRPAPQPRPPPPRRIAARPARAPSAEVEPLPAGKPSAVEGTDELSDAQVASASTADSGGGSGGRGCNMTRRLQSKLRQDPLVRAAVADAHRGKAILIWNGDWIRHGEQDGHGLAAVREAIMWEVAFAPEACRAEPVHGMVLISLADVPGAPRLVVGSNDWRWSDLLGRGRTLRR